VNLPVGALAIVLAVLFLPNDHEEAKSRALDLGGLALLSPGLFSSCMDRIISANALGLQLCSFPLLSLLSSFGWPFAKEIEPSLIYNFSGARPSRPPSSHNFFRMEYLSPE
jgi:hypothetical protein